MSIGLFLAAVIAQAPLSSASPSPTATPVVLYALRPPNGWQQRPVSNNVPGIFQLLAMYVGPSVGGFSSNINVLRDPLKDQAETIVQRAAETQASYRQNGNNVTTSRAEKVCQGTLDGWYMESSGTEGGTQTARIQTFLLSDGIEYVATYSRPIGTDPNPAAVKALDTLCPQPQ